jgi:hypothetical protein
MACVISAKRIAARVERVAGEGHGDVSGESGAMRRTLLRAPPDQAVSRVHEAQGGQLVHASWR